MTWCANGAVICDHCGHFCRPVDSHAPFGGTGPEGLDPPEDEHVCAKCWPALKEGWVRRFAAGHLGGEWHKSDAEVEAAREAGLEWVHQNGLVDTRTNRDVLYRYIRTVERDYYAPWLEWRKDHPRNALVRAAPTEGESE